WTFRGAGSICLWNPARLPGASGSDRRRNRTTAAATAGCFCVTSCRRTRGVISISCAPAGGSEILFDNRPTDGQGERVRPVRAASVFLAVGEVVMLRPFARRLRRHVSCALLIGCLILVSYPLWGVAQPANPLAPVPDEKAQAKA